MGDHSELLACFGWLDGCRRAGFTLHTPNEVHAAHAAGRFWHDSRWLVMMSFGLI